MNEFQIFIDQLQKELSEHFGNSYRVTVTETEKNNGAVRYGVMISDGKTNLSPTVYLEELYRQYTEGKTLCEVMGEVIRIYEGTKAEKKVDVRFLTDFSRVRDRIVYRLFGYESNRRRFAGVPHIRFLDMVLVCYLILGDETAEDAAVLVTAGLCRLWGIDGETLFDLAERNTPGLFPVRLLDMRSLTGQKESYMYVVTNQKAMYGAGCILYPGVPEQFAEKTDSSFYILPSSVHEMLLIPDRLPFCAEKFGGIVREMNRRYVEPTEILTDSVYYYDKEKEKILLLDNSENL